MSDGDTHDDAPIVPAIEGEVVNHETSYDLTVTAKLIEAFNNRYNITEACHYAGITRQTYYNWLEWHAEFANKMEQAKMMPNRRAKEVVIKAIDEGDVNTAKWLLDRTDPDFKAKLEVDPGERSRQTRDKIKEFLNEPTSYETPANNDAGGSEPAQSDASSAEPVADATASSDSEVAATTPDIS